MAGINLSGAIGMTGKRESVYSDVPSIIQQTGDFIAKARLEAKEQKAKLAAAQREKDLEDAYKQQNALRVTIKEGADLSLLKPQFEEFTDKKVKESKDIFENPNIPKSVRVAEFDRILGEISTAAGYLKNNEKAFREAQKDKENPIYDTSEQQAVLAGVYGIDYMKPQAPNNTNAAYDVPTPEQQAPIPQIEVKKPFHQMTYDEMTQEHPRGLEYSLLDKKKLVNVTPSAAIEYTLPKNSWDAMLDSNANNQTHKINEKNYNLEKATWINAVVSGKNDKTKVVKAGLEAEAINLINRDHQDFNTQQKEQFINDFVLSQAGKMFEEKAKIELDTIKNDRNKDWAKSGREAATSKENAPIEREVPANQDVVDEIKDKIYEHKKVLDNYKTVNKDRLSESRKIYNTPNVDRNSQEYKDASDEIIKYQTALQNKAALDVQLKNELAKKTKVKDLNAKDENVNFSIDGTNMVVDATGYRRDKDGNVFVYVNIPTGEKNVFEKKAIAYTPEMATELKPETINLLRKYGYIDENNEPIKTKKSVSSQPQAAPKDYGTRADGTKKGKGFLGEIKTKDGKVMTEKTTSVDFGLGEMNIPLIVNGLTKEEIDILSNNKKPTEVMLDKAVNHAKKRMSEGQSPYENGGTLKSKSGKKIKLNLKTNKFEYAE